MRSKRLLAMLLTFCLLFSFLAPTARAVVAPLDSIINADKNDGANASTNKNNGSPIVNDLLVSGNKTNGPHTMRDSLISKIESAITGGDWVVTPAEDPDVDMMVSDTPDCLEELKEASKYYSASDIVSAFVVMEEAPLAETYTSRTQVAASVEKAMIKKQNTVISAIERNVLKGGDLKVRYQFTYLTNSFSIETSFENLEKIAKISGVKSVFIMPVYNPTAADPNTAASGAMTGVHTVWQDLGYTGQGMKIAIIDTGLDLDHPSFSALDSQLVADYDSYLSTEDVAAVLEDLNAYKSRSSITAADLYRTTKVPFAFNYCDDNLKADHSADDQGDHGTHVAGIAAANKTEGTAVVGMAPDAQIIVLKVFGANGGAYADDIVAALEDAMTLGCDVVNASLGSAAGFSSTDTEIDAIYERLANQNIVATISAGNEGTSSYNNMWGTNLNHTKNPDNGVVGSPSTYANAFSIASAENCEVQTPYFALADGTKVFFNNDTYGFYFGYTTGMAPLIGQELEYVVIDGLGNYEDYFDADGNSLVAGKVAVVFRGEINFGEKIYNAEMAGAVACIIANNSEEDIFNFMMNDSLTDEFGNEYYASIPTCLITMADGEKMAAAETKTMAVSAETAARVVEGGQMSSFSSWGVSSDLRLLPDITGIGGNVYSCYDGGQYGIMSGTSMSAPQIAGISALVMQYLYKTYPNDNDGKISDMARAILMSTAAPVISNESGLEASPRQQGAGLVDAAAAVNTKAFLTVNGGRPKAELGDNAYGKYTFTFEITNISDEAQTYTLSSSLLTEDVVDPYGIGEYFMAGYDVALSGEVNFSADTVEVPAGETVEVTVSISLSAKDKVMFARYWENGGYVEGFVYLNNADEQGVDLSLPFLGFYGDWTEAPVFDSAYWYDNSFWDYAPTDDWTDGDEYYHVLWTTLQGTDYVLGFNPYSGAYTDMFGNVVYDPANNSVSPNGDGVVDGIDEIYLSLLRNAKVLTFTYSDAETGEVYSTETITNATKTMYLTAYGQVVPWIYSWYSNGMFDFSTLENNTKVLLTIDAKLDYDLGGENTIQIPITVDTEAPKLLDAYQIEEDDGSHSLVVITSDNVNVAGMFLMNPSGTRIYGEDYAMEALNDGTYMATFNVDDLGTELMVCLGDYAGNEAYYDITYTEAEDNLPDMTPYADMLLAYRVLDNYIYSDHMYGWVAMNKPAAGEDAYVSVMTDDYMEFAAINAAEYAGGKIFAVDAVHNLVVMDPGLFDRKIVTNLGVNVLDMTFDDSTDTMYVLTKDEDFTSLCSMDLLTGELTELHYYGYFTYAPWAIADDDNGTLYAIMTGSSSIYTLDVEGGTYEMTAATVPMLDENGEIMVDEETGETVMTEAVITDSAGDAVSPASYSQSITYKDGKLYWAYYAESGWYGISELITIDTADWSCHASAYLAQAYDEYGELVEYYPVTELVGLLTLTETDYEIPASDAAVSIGLDAEQIIVGLNGQHTLTASWLPWNYALDESQIVWTSDDETIATVVDGKVFGVGEGVTTVTAEYNGLTASCQVIVVDISGSVEAYNFYTADGYYGYMIDIDMETMNYSLVSGYSPVDFYAGDYNGHDGYFYGYDMGGQLYRYDYETNEATALGASLGTYPVDMAYDYSTGMMYALTLDYNTYENKLYAVNMTTGKALEMATGSGLMTLAISTDGIMYGMDASGYLCELAIKDYSMYGMGMYLEPTAYVLEQPFGELYMLGSMCWDHNNDVLLWNWCDAATMLWIDVGERSTFEEEDWWTGEMMTYVSYAGGYYVDLGDPSESGVLQLTGLHVVPDEITPLPEIPVESLTAEDMLILTGYEKVPSAVIAPFNATCQNITLSVADPTVVEVTASGNLMGLKAGVTQVTAKLEDTVGGQTHEVTFTVTVMEGADNMHAHLLTDVATYDMQAWIDLYPGNPGQYDVSSYFGYTIFTAEHVDGKIYTYGYDANDWTANWQFFIMDEATKTIETQIDMGAAFPFVYDMTYDHATSTMYVLAGPSETNTELYVADMETGKLILLMEVEPLFLALAAAPDGKLYAIENSKEEYDEFDPWAAPTVSNANLWAIDPLNGTMELVGDTGIKSNMISSMAYDYDTDTMYWTAFAQVTSYDSNLAIVDLETGLATSLGTIGTAGAQVGGLYFVCDEYPAADNSTLHNVLMSESKKSVVTGGTETLSVILVPGALDAQMTWTSSDETVATVDENGVVTGVSQGNAIITVTASYNGTEKTASCAVAVLDEDATFLTWNATDMGWALVNRWDYTLVEMLTEGEEIGVATFTSLGNDIYGYDENNQLFKLNTETFERTLIGEPIADEEGYKFVVKDMAYDAANGQMLVLGDTLAWDDYWEEYSEIYNGCGLYALDLTTGELELLYVFEEYTYVCAMSVGTEGEVYFYTTFDDTVNVLNLTDYSIGKIITLQSQDLSGDTFSTHSMHYDVLTDTLYLAFTSNGNFYKMVTVDPLQGTLTDCGYIGETVEEGWYVFSDTFHGLTYPETKLTAPAPEYEIVFKSASTDMNTGNINLNFAATLSDSILANETAEMHFEFNGNVQIVPVSEAKAFVKDGETRYRFPCNLPAKCMADDVVAQLYIDGEPVGDSKTYSVRDYCQKALEVYGQIDGAEEMLAVVKTMLNYGAAAQIHFGYNTDNLANSILDDADKVLADVDASGYAVQITGAEDGIKAKSARLELESDTELSVSFQLTGDKTIDEYTFTIDGQEVTPVLNGDRYYVKLAGITVTELADVHEFKVGGLTVTCSALTYVNLALRDGQPEDLQELAKAIHAFYTAADAYFN